MIGDPDNQLPDYWICTVIQIPVKDLPNLTYNCETGGISPVRGNILGSIVYAETRLGARNSVVVRLLAGAGGFHFQIHRVLTSVPTNVVSGGQY
jgi:hypothetical protein